MMEHSFIERRPAGIALLLGGGLWLLSGLRFPAAVDGSSASRALDVGPYLLAPAVMLLLIGLAGLLGARLSLLGKLGLAGLISASAGFAEVAGAGLAGSGRGDSALAPGFVLISVGLLLIGGRLLSRHARCAWHSLPLLLGMFALLLPMGAGVEGMPGLATWIVFGVGWLWLGAIALAGKVKIGADQV